MASLVRRDWDKLIEIFDENLPTENVTQSEVVRVTGKVEKYLRLLHEGSVYLKLIRGAVVSAALNKREADHGTRYGQGFMESIHEEVQKEFGHSVAISTLYEERAVYERVVLNYNNKLTSLLDFMERFKAIHGRVTWFHVKTQFTSDVVPEKIYGSREAAAEITAKKVEQLTSEIESVAGSSLSRDEQVQSAVITSGQSLQSLRDRSQSLVGKQVTYQSDKYENWIRTQPCPITGAINEPQGERVVDLFHIWSGVEGAKESSLVTIPMHRDLHREFHAMGIDQFAYKYGHVFGEEKINWYRLAMNYLHQFITGFAFDLGEGPALREHAEYMGE